MSELFGNEYFGFIAGAYGIVAVSLIALLVWVIFTQKSREQQLALLEKQGLKRASRQSDDD